MWRYSISLLLLMVPTGPLIGAEPALPVRHDLQVTLQLQQGQLQVQDRITLPSAVPALQFVLHAGLRVEVRNPGARLSTLGVYRGSVPGTRYRVEFGEPRRQLTLDYRGTIRHEVEHDRRGAAGERPRGTSGTISEQGVFLSGSALWYPLIPGRMVSFKMRVDLPEGWLAVSQGQALSDAPGWTERAPQDDIYLIAGKYRRYQLQGADIEAQVYLREPDDALAQRYLQATLRYTELYSRLLGPYPFRKFAMVENFWESGYGMPSFTLLGPRVLRFPFILNSSYPHEILHNWWGNGVYVDYSQGNWSEGLTAYLADHLLREAEGQGSAYRRDTLQRYADFVHQGNDFPLSRFRGRHGDSSQAVGYGKTLMLFHMLRRELGDARFLEALRRFYRDQLFRTAGYDDLRAAFESVAERDLGGMFAQWTERTGAPALRISAVNVTEENGGYRLAGLLQQTQPEPAYRLAVPLLVQLPQGAFRETTIDLRERSQRFSIALPQRPLRLLVDPRFDLFRRLVEGETPSSLGRLFGAEAMTIVLPSNAPSATRAALEQLAKAWSRRWSDLDIVWDAQLEELPRDRSLWLLGSGNRFAAAVTDQLKGRLDAVDTKQWVIDGHAVSLDDHSIAVTATHPRQPELTVGLLHLGAADAATGLARKLPHYGKYSYTVFAGKLPDNTLKGQWPTGNSALAVDLVEDDRLPAWSPPPGTALMEQIEHQPVHKNRPAR